MLIRRARPQDPLTPSKNATSTTELAPAPAPRRRHTRYRPSPSHAWYRTMQAPGMASVEGKHHHHYAHAPGPWHGKNHHSPTCMLLRPPLELCACTNCPHMIGILLCRHPSWRLRKAGMPPIRTCADNVRGIMIASGRPWICRQRGERASCHPHHALDM